MRNSAVMRLLGVYSFVFSTRLLSNGSTLGQIFLITTRRPHLFRRSPGAIQDDL